ncbi:MAG TPA: SUF system NifU family Fe-S cluster assembly protein [Myxococcota bacterium]|nr:SUF system NifU family Fe-S cluster assembly protein [Myxococcota bacterium]
MSDLFDLYQALIIDHSRSPKNFGELSLRTHHAAGNNPLCGDSIELFLQVVDGKIEDIAFKGDGCAIAKASASLMTEKVKHKSLEQALGLFADFHAMLVEESDETESLGKLAALKGVRQFPIRIKCATLCWHTLNAALKDQAHVAVSTE